jgi:hypothetical protein
LWWDGWSRDAVVSLSMRFGDLELPVSLEALQALAHSLLLVARTLVRFLLFRTYASQVCCYESMNGRSKFQLRIVPQVIVLIRQKQGE